MCEKEFTGHPNDKKVSSGLGKKYAEDVVRTKDR
jgi:hypothetical protein